MEMFLNTEDSRNNYKLLQRRTKKAVKYKIAKDE